MPTAELSIASKLELLLDVTKRTSRSQDLQELLNLSRVPKDFAQKLFEFMLDACEKHKVQQNSVSPATIGVG